MKPEKIILTLSMFLFFFNISGQNSMNARKEFETNLKNAPIEDGNIITGNDVSNDYNEPEGFLPGGGISGSVIRNGSSTDFVGLNSVGLNQYGQPGTINGKPVAWVFDGYSWRNVPVSQLSIITYNDFAIINGRAQIKVTVSLKDGAAYDYTYSPAENNINVLVNSGGNYVQEKSMPVFSSGRLVIAGILFY